VRGVEVKVDGVLQEPPVAEAEFGDRLMAYITRDPELYVKWLQSTHLLRSSDWLQSEEVISAVKAEWDELGEIVASFSREVSS
jgi:hypothetical protein